MCVCDCVFSNVICSLAILWGLDGVQVRAFIE